MHIVVMGAGALGGLVGAQLHIAGEDVTLIEINQARARLISENGLLISEGLKGERCVPIRVVTSAEEVEEADLVFIAVKSYQTETATRTAMTFLKPDAFVLSMQNGIGNTDTMAGIIGEEQVICGITYHSIQHTGPNRIRFRPGIKPIQIAPYNGIITPRLELIGEVFGKAGLETEIVENIDDTIWQKLLHNAVVNPVSAVTGLTCRELLLDEDLQDFMRDLCMEIIAVMRARGVPIIDEEDPYRPVTNSQRALGKNRPSMWQDLAKGTLTEVDAINGPIVREAERLGLQAPINQALVRLIHSEERKNLNRQQEITATLKSATESAPRESAQPVRLEDGGAMPSGRVPLQTAPALKDLVRDYYLDVQRASDDPDRLIAWTSGMGPVEIVRAMGMTPYFPENHAALIGASRQASRYIPRALAEGFSQFASSAMTCDIGAMLAGDSPLVSVYGIAGPPPADVVIFSTNYGHGLIRWFDYYSGHFGVPALGLHPPTALGEVGKIEVDAAAGQMDRMIARLEGITGKELDIDRLAESVAHSAKAAGLWTEIVQLARNVPSPLTTFDLLVHMAPMVMMRGTPEAVEYYEILKAEIEDRVSNTLAAVPGERFRFYWEGPPVWGALMPLAKLFFDHQIALISSTYCSIWGLEGLDPENPIESMARAYTGIFTNRSDSWKSTWLTSQFEANAIDAVVYHEGRTSPEHSNVRYGLEVKLRRSTGLPSIVIESDAHDLRLFSIRQLQQQLLDFLERQDGSMTDLTVPQEVL
ncbi:2-dehydropantoate 2-reductase [Gemmatimonadota bacterium]